MDRLWGHLVVVGLGLGVVVVGCSNDSGGGFVGTVTTILPPEQRSLEPGPGIAKVIEESDLFKVDGTWLYVQNPSLGLTVIDVADPDAPVLAQQLPAVVGDAGELYVRPTEALVVFEESALSTGNAEVVTVLNPTTGPSVGDRLNLPGRLVVSRLIGDVLYAVTAQARSNQAPPQTWLASIDVSDPLNLIVLDEEHLVDQAHEVHVTNAAIYLAQHLIGDPVNDTRLRTIDITDPAGALVERGSIDLRGSPPGRFYMDADGTEFRIVTYNERVQVSTNLFVIDTTDLDNLTVIGSIEDLAWGEELRATRFEGDRAYVVTWRRPVQEISGFPPDPLFVIDLSDPTNPTVLGELHIPGWSDYVFPRNDYLLAVGRGDMGRRVAVSLFDISDLTNPTLVRRVDFGIGNASSEANTDFRGVTVVEAGILGTDALVAVPFTNHHIDDITGDCSPEQRVQLIDLLPTDIALRGSAPQVGVIRRTVPIGSKLYAIGDKTVAAMDVANRDAPFNAVTVNVGDLSAPDECTPVFAEEPITRVVGGCTLGEQADPTTPLVFLTVLGSLVILRMVRT